jgi:putative DNA primase/helicase
MTLHAIVAALGGDLYQNGRRANVPGPGHSRRDRSVSLLLAEGRVVIHGFGGADWRVVRDDLCKRGLTDPRGRLVGAVVGAPCPPRPAPAIRSATAARLWEDALPLGPGSAASRYLQNRSVDHALGAFNLRFHPRAPISVYRGPDGPTCAALVARISDDEDRLTAVELTYLTSNGLPHRHLYLPRKTIGRVPVGAAVRLAPAAARMLVGEGAITTLSAIKRFNLPGWALMAANNLAGWMPPPSVRTVLIAADRGRAGEAAAARLDRRLRVTGLDVTVALPEPPFGDWNEVEAAEAKKRREEGR